MLQLRHGRALRDQLDEAVLINGHMAPVSRGPAVLATIAALALVNLGLAPLIAAAVGARGFVPIWAALALLVLGVMAAALAVTLWRGYLRSLRDP